MIRLVIGYTWDGAVLPEADRASVVLTLTESELVIEVDAPYRGDPPPTGPVGPTDRLWEHEVIEVFVVGEGERYTEIELSPHGHHWVLRLEGIRSPMTRGIPIAFEATIEGERWRGIARIERSHLPDEPVRCNVFRISGVGTARRFAAWVPVPGPAPDFHRLEQFGPWLL
ncbi:MAG TPA: hypothetical protein ENK18_23300 [Deltaproteobacteria bacterium]|nr:hypothetical protein [Deltaproteobacteria bacterium]